MGTYEIGNEIEPAIGSDIERIARRELARRAVDAIAEVLEVEVSVSNLLVLARDDEPPDVRLAAKRALRCVEAFGRPDSEVARRVGEVGLYHYVEGVIEYGASERKFLELMADHRLSAEEVTGLYAVRELLVREGGSTTSGFPTLIRALATVGLSPWQAACDPEEAVSTLYEAGYFMDHAGRKVYDWPIFAPGLVGVPLGRNVDTSHPIELLTWTREYFARLREGKPEED